MLLHEIVEFAASARPCATALISNGAHVDFAGLERRIGVVATLLSRTVPPGERIVLVAENHLDVVTLMYAAPRAGVIVAFGNTRHTPVELLDLVEATDPALVVAGVDHLERLAEPLATARPSLPVWSLGGRHRAAAQDLSAEADSFEGQVTTDDPIDVDADDCAWLIHTSGTTGRPKGVRLTHRSLLAAVTSTAVARPLSDDDVYLFPFPLFHVAGYNVLHAHLRRRPVVLLPRFEPTSVFDALREHEVTCCSLAPTMLAMLLDHPERDDAALANLRQISYGASAMPLDLLRRVTRELPGCGLAQGYGMTELSGNAVFLSPDDHRLAAAGQPHLLAAAGRPGPLAAVRIVDDDDHELPEGDPGEILVRGDQVCDGYWNDPEATAASRLGRWLRTGDIGKVVDGVLYVVDRKKDLIITGGENVASREVEDLLGQHPAVAQVAVVGIPDERWGETVCAVVVAEDAESFDGEELMRWTDGRIAGFKRPRRIVRIDGLPTNASGKVDKVRLRAVVAPVSGEPGWSGPVSP